MRLITFLLTVLVLGVASAKVLVPTPIEAATSEQEGSKANDGIVIEARLDEEDDPDNEGKHFGFVDPYLPPYPPPPYPYPPYPYPPPIGYPPYPPYPYPYPPPYKAAHRRR